MRQKLKSKVRARVNRQRTSRTTTLACGQRDNSQSRTESKGFAIQKDRFWSRISSKWRRNREGEGDSPSPAPRSLEHLLKQVEKGTQVRRRGLDQVLSELKQHRDSTPDADLQSALTWLCNAQSRLVSNPNAARSREVLMAADAVKRILARAAGTPR
jgi:hypothetical protein